MPEESKKRKAKAPQEVEEEEVAAPKKKQKKAAAADEDVTEEPAPVLKKKKKAAKQDEEDKPATKKAFTRKQKNKPSKAVFDEEEEEEEEEEDAEVVAKKVKNAPKGARIFVGGLQVPCDEAALRKRFARYGEIEDLTIPPGRGGKKLTSKCIAFITYKTKDAATSALAVDGMDFSGAALKVQLSSGVSKPDDKAGGVKSDTIVFVSGLGSGCTEEAVKKHFSKCGDIVKLEVPPSKKKKDEIRGLAFITYKEKAGAEAALALDGTVTKMGTLQVKEFVVPPGGEGGKDNSKAEYKVVVTNLPKPFEEDRVRLHFKECGVVKKYKQSRGTVFLNFVSPLGVERALKLNGKLFKGRALKVAVAPADEKADSKKKKGKASKAKAKAK